MKSKTLMFCFVLLMVLLLCTLAACKYEPAGIREPEAPRIVTANLMNLSGSGWVTIGGPVTVETTGFNLVNAFGTQGTAFTKTSAPTGPGTWGLQGNIPSTTDTSYSAIVRPNENIDGESRGVVRFTRPATNFGAQIGIYYRFNLGTIPSEGQRYYIRTYLRIESGSLVQTENEADFRVSIYPTVSAELGAATVRSRLDLTNLANIPTITWRKYDFVVFVPASLQNNFMEIRLALPNSFETPPAVTMDMATVEVFRADLSN